MMDSQIPHTCRAAEIENLEASLARKVREGMTDKRGALLYGPTGLGKTFAMVAAMKAISRAMPSRQFGPNVILDEERNTVCKFVDWPEFVAGLDRNENATSQLFAWRGPLFVDDVGQEHFAASGYKQGWAESIFEQFVNRRTGSGLALWVTTNLMPNEMRDRYGERAMSRLAEHCVLIRLEGADRRLTA